MTTSPISTDLPFRISIEQGVALVADFAPDIHRHYADLERELPIVKDAIRELVEQGYRQFIFDLTTADATAAYPIVKWGATYGALQTLKRTYPHVEGRELAQGIKLIGDESRLWEVRTYRLDWIFECHATRASARAALSPTEGQHG